LVASYEELRRDALGGAMEHGVGRALLMRQGMAAWIAACLRCGPRRPAATTSGERSALPSGVRGEVVRLLVEMALGACRQEAAR
jgi:hypothetical protein